MSSNKASGKAAGKALKFEDDNYEPTTRETSRPSLQTPSSMVTRSLKRSNSPPAYRGASRKKMCNVGAAGASPDLGEFRNRHTQDCPDALEQAIAMVKKTEDDHSDLEKDMRLRHELPTVRAYLEAAQPPKFLLYSEWRANNCESAPGNVLLGTMADATNIIDHGPIRTPILVPKEFRGSSTRDQTVERFLNTFHMAEYLSIQHYKARMSESSYPLVMHRDEFIKHLRKPSPKERLVPVNCLDLGSSHPPPACVEAIPSLALLDNACGNSVGSRQMSAAALAHERRFALVASQRAWSLAHNDRSSVITTVEGVAGDKLWLTWALSFDQLREFGPVLAKAIDTKATIPPPPGTPVAVRIRPGDLFIQPAGTLHAPYSPSNVAMRGSMHWDSRDLDHHMELSLLQAKHEALCNEDQAGDFYPLMGRAIHSMEQSRPPYSQDQDYKWPSDGGQTKAKQLFEEWVKQYRSHEDFKHYFAGCTCTIGQCNSCICFQRDVPCGEWCHKKKDNPKCLTYPSRNTGVARDGGVKADAVGDSESQNEVASEE